MSYAEFLFCFLILPTIGLAGFTWVLRKGRFLNKVDFGHHWRGVGILAFIAFVWTTPWDNYLIARGVWDSPPDRTLGKILYVPIEEYAFFVLMPIFNGAVIFLLFGLGRIPASTWQTPQRWPRAVFVIIAGLLFCGGLYALRSDSGTYLGLILLWFTPPLLIQWLFDPATLLRGIWFVLGGTLLPLIYFGIADHYAIRQGIWVLSETQTTGLGLPQLPIEELLFFAVTSLLLAQGLVLWHSLRPTPPQDEVAL